MKCSDPAIRSRFDLDPAMPPLEPGPVFDKGGSTFLEGVTLGIG